MNFNEIIQIELMSLDLLWFIISFFKADSIMDSLTTGPGYMYTSSEHLYESQLCVWKVRRVRPKT